jgi:hypothetical protein
MTTNLRKKTIIMQEKRRKEAARRKLGSNFKLYPKRRSLEKQFEIKRVATPERRFYARALIDHVSRKESAELVTMVNLRTSLIKFVLKNPKGMRSAKEIMSYFRDTFGYDVNDRRGRTFVRNVYTQLSDLGAVDFFPERKKAVPYGDHEREQGRIVAGIMIADDWDIAKRKHPPQIPKFEEALSQLFSRK